MGMIVGVDEAGRGPVVGPLVIGVFACLKEEEVNLRKMGVKDSKMLGEAIREKLALKLKHRPHVLVEVSAEEITREMRRKVSLNELEAKKVAEGIMKINEELKKSKQEINTVFVDSPDPVATKFERRIRKYLPEKLKALKMVSENKADVKYVVVGAASILAKSLRERRVSEIAQELGGDFGSGYPSDERTMRFVKRRQKDARLQKYLRHEWETIKKLQTAKVKLSDFG